MRTTEPGAETRIVMHDVSWDFYRRMRDEVGDGNIRLTYSNGSNLQRWLDLGLKGDPIDAVDALRQWLARQDRV